MKFINFIKNNFFNDYLLKLISLKYMYNIYIYLGYFFAEKYIIEVNTRYIFQWILYIMNNKNYLLILPSFPLLT